MDAESSSERLLATAFATGVIAAATALLWAGRLTGGDWVTTTTWVVSALMLGRAATVAAGGYAVTAQAKAVAVAQRATGGVA